MSMTRRSRRRFGALLAGAVLFTAACGGGTETESDAAADSDQQDQQWPEEFNQLVFPTGSQGGGGYSWGTVAGQLWAEELDLQVEVQAGGGTSNIPLLENEQVQFAAAGALDYAAIHGEPPTEDSTNIRTFWTLYPLSLHTIVNPDSDAQKLSDLAESGDAIAIGAPDSGENLYFREAVECIDMTADDFNIQELGKDEATAAYKDGNIEAWFAGGPAPMPQFLEVLESSPGGKLVDIDPEIVECLAGKGTGWAADEMHDEYELDQPVTTANLWYPIVTTTAVPDELVYEMARVVDERYDDLVAAYAGASFSTAENTATIPGFPLHPGVEKYLRDTGALK
jgi:TRAP transporter TAXI family solute receptor